MFVYYVCMMIVLMSIENTLLVVIQRPRRTKRLAREPIQDSMCATLAQEQTHQSTPPTHSPQAPHASQ